MKKGAYKKIMLGLLGVFFVFGSLLTPTPKSEKVLAQSNDCKYISSKFDPAGELSEFKTGESFDVNIFLDLENCKGKEVSAEIVSEGNPDRTALLIKKVVENEGSIRMTLSTKRGSFWCTDDPGVFDCKIHYNIDIDGKEVYSSEDKNSDFGVLYYEDASDHRDAWKFVSSSEQSVNSGGQDVDFWYFKLKDGKYIPASTEKITEAECKDLAKGKDGIVDCAKSGTFNSDLIVEGSQSGNPNIKGECGVTSMDGFAWCFVGLSEILVNFVLGGLVGIAGKFFDLIFSISIDSRAYGGGGNTIQFLKDGWTILRDLANLGFIFTLLFISIKQIVSTSSDIIKKTLPKIIIMGLLINFSYFFGTVIVDATNVLARLFYSNDAICVVKEGAPTDPNTGKPKCSGTISEALASKLQPQTIISQSSTSLLEMGESTVSPGLYFLIIAISGYCLWRIFKVFFKVAMLFLGRIVQIWVLLVLSPLAFLNEILPNKIKSLSPGPITWAKTLFENAFIAPMFMFFLYLIFLVMSGLELAFNFEKTSGTFTSLITLILPIIALTIILDAAVNYTKKQAGAVANMVADIATKAIGAVAGTGLALGGLAFGGAIVKGGGKLLGGAGQRLIAREGKGNSTIGRAFNSRLANIGGKLNDYGKKLPDKSLDIRNTKLSKAVAGATGFNMNSYGKEVGKGLDFLKLKPSETYNQRKERIAKESEADVERRKIVEKTNKMESELGAEYAKRQEDLKKYKEKIYNKDLTADSAFEQAKSEGTFKGTKAEWVEDFVNKNHEEDVQKYKEQVSKSAGFFDAKNAKEYEKAAKEFNANIQSNFDYKKARDVYGGKTNAETMENKEANRQSGAGLASPGDMVGAAGKTGLAGFAATAAGAAATGGVLAGAGLLASAAANYQRAGDVEYLRRREEKIRKANSEEVEKEEMLQDRQKSKLSDIEESLKDLTGVIKGNTKVTKDASDQTTNSFKDLFDNKLKKYQDENDKRKVSGESPWSDKKTENKAFNEAYADFIKHISETIRGLGAAAETATGAIKTDLENRIREAEEIKQNVSKAKEGYDKKEDERGKAEEAMRKSKERLEKLRGSSADKKDEKGGDKKDSTEKGSEDKDKK